MLHSLFACVWIVPPINCIYSKMKWTIVTFWGKRQILIKIFNNKKDAYKKWTWNKKKTREYKKKTIYQYNYYEIKIFIWCLRVCMCVYFEKNIYYIYVWQIKRQQKKKKNAKSENREIMCVMWKWWWSCCCCCFLIYIHTIKCQKQNDSKCANVAGMFLIFMTKSITWKWNNSRWKNRRARLCLNDC